MATTFRLLERAIGRMAPSAQRFMADRLDLLVGDLLVTAIDRWDKDGWNCFDHTENSRTIRLYSCLLNACHNDRRFALLKVEVEAALPTKGMLDGTESVANMRRPDLRLSVGPASRLVECKRLAAGSVLQRKYVIEGVRRFVSGGYGASESAAAMVGYIDKGDADAVVAEINTIVDRQPGMGPSHRLDGGQSPLTVLSLRHSSHERQHLPTLHLTHYLIDLS